VEEPWWDLVRRQHGVVSREQLLARGLGSEAVAHRLTRARLHRIERGVYAVGRPEVSRHGRWMAAVLGCGSGAALSHDSAAALWGILATERAGIHVAMPPGSRRRRPGVTAHRCDLSPAEIAVRDGIPVTSVARTLLDVAAQRGRDRLEVAINEADKLDLIEPDTLRKALDAYPGQRGVARLRSVLDRRTFALTDSQLERRFLAIADRAGLPLPLTGQRLNGFKVDFVWPDLGLVVETDGLRYHRTPAQQARDRQRDQAHTAAGLTALRFTHAQVRYEADHVRSTLVAVAKRLHAARVVAS
jgi:hypothetical protein